MFISLAHQNGVHDQVKTDIIFILFFILFIKTPKKFRRRKPKIYVKTIETIILDLVSQLYSLGWYVHRGWVRDYHLRVTGVTHTLVTRGVGPFLEKCAFPSQ